ncbi:MAG TPA: MerR family transcriptional regulator [Flavobacterium sp.]|nr:MerR family transcriptional regulator [Flavobacterium sp.]HPJ09768.1 MerR family transcriptional regulator [Flavobacterium sp.]
MNSGILSSFSIKDLENLSGIKSHTIRMWEKRYAVLSPMRTESNIRYYDSANLQKLLNITLLHQHGYKISQISKMSEEKLGLLLRQIISEKSVKHHAVNGFKMAMMNFDQTLFINTYNALLTEKSFSEVFHQVFIPLMVEIGMLWQTDTITPAHEHFISYLIRQKILTSIEKVQVLGHKREDKVFVLFLPYNELHDIGLMYLHYEIMLNGYKSIYLGESVPMQSLRDVKQLFSNIVYVSYFTVEPKVENLSDFMEQFNQEVMGADSAFWVLGKMASSIKSLPNPRMRTFGTIAELVNEL